MGNNQKKIQKKKPVITPFKLTFLCTGAVIVLATVFLIIKGIAGSGDTTTIQGGDISIKKSEITETAKFYPYLAGNTKMEVLAVKAPDGTIRTAFNTCQVCYSSGRGYYIQEGDELVCQNCGNRFKISEVEQVKGGCNPVPILENDKKDDGTTVTITESFLEQNKGLFGNWKKG